MFNWTPTLLYGSSFPLTTTGVGLTMFNLGGVIGAIMAAIITSRVGSCLLLISLASVATLLCVGLTIVPISAGRNASVLLDALFALGLTANATQATLFALSANAFPAKARGRGMGPTDAE